jgi:hypothetical protein
MKTGRRVEKGAVEVRRAKKKKRMKRMAIMTKRKRLQSSFPCV